jgi:hypothetical protein
MPTFREQGGRSNKTAIFRKTRKSIDRDYNSLPAQWAICIASVIACVVGNLTPNEIPRTRGMTGKRMQCLRISSACKAGNLHRISHCLRSGQSNAK